MLAEGFLRVLSYKDERRFTSRQHKAQTHSHCTDAVNCVHPVSNSTDPQTDSTEAGKQLCEVVETKKRRKL